MTLQEFMTSTGGVPPSVLRRAILAALAAEVPRDHQAYARFYERVIAELAVPEDRCVAVGR